MTTASTSESNPSRDRFLESFIGLGSLPEKVSAPFTQWPDTASMRRFLDSFSSFGPAPRQVVRNAQRAFPAATDERVKERFDKYFRS